MDRFTTPDFLAIGVLTNDVTPEPGNPHGRVRAGGAASFAARCASALGLRPAVVASAASNYPVEAILPGIDVRLVESGFTTFFQNVYSPSGVRSQVLGARSRTITCRDIPEAWRDAPLVLLGPLVNEVPPEALEWFPNSTVAATVQGWLREWDQYGRVSESPMPPPGLPGGRDRKYDLLTGSTSELPADDAAAMSEWLNGAKAVGVTDGQNGAYMFTAESRTQVPAFPAQELDPTGAGDVWSAACLIRLAETSDPVEAAQFANAAASLTVEREGLAGIPDRATVQGRMDRG